MHKCVFLLCNRCMCMWDVHRISPVSCVDTSWGPCYTTLHAVHSHLPPRGKHEDTPCLVVHVRLCPALFRQLSADCTLRSSTTPLLPPAVQENARVQQLEGQLATLARASTSPPGRTSGGASPVGGAQVARRGGTDAEDMTSESRDTVSDMGGGALRKSNRFSTVAVDCFDEDDDEEEEFVLKQQHSLSRAARQETGRGASGRYGF